MAGVRFFSYICVEGCGLHEWLTFLLLLPLWMSEQAHITHVLTPRPPTCASRPPLTLV